MSNIQKKTKKTKSNLNTNKLRLAKQKCDKKILDLFNHEKHNRIFKQSFGDSKRNTAFSVTQKDGKNYLYTGLTKKLKSLLYPDTHEGMENRGKVRKNKYYKPPVLKKDINNHNHNYTINQSETLCGPAGKEHGTKVHEQLEYYINAYINDHTLCVTDIKYPNGHLDPCVISIIKTLITKNWSPLRAEMKIFDEKLRIATSIDLLVRDLTENKLLLIELKTGYESEQYSSLINDPFFPTPFNTISNCPQTRHMLQLMGMHEILHRSYGIKVDGAYVLRVLPKMNSKVFLCKMSKWAIAKRNRDNLYKLLEETAKQ